MRYIILIPLMACAAIIGVINSSALASNQAAQKTTITALPRTAIETDAQRDRLARAAGILARYEIEAGKLLDLLKRIDDQARPSLQQQNQRLLALAEEFIHLIQFRLPQCDTYLSQSLLVKAELDEISHERLERDYHHDAVLPDAPGECYHSKDLFIHPATIAVLVRDDPALRVPTRHAIEAEITEVLAHTEVIRLMVIY